MGAGLDVPAPSPGPAADAGTRFLVLLPGTGCSARLWARVLDQDRPELRTAQVLTPRLTGRTLDGCVADLLERLPDRFALAGLSLGGIVAMALVRTAPQRVTRLCLMATNPHAPTRPQLEGWVGQRAALDSGLTARDLQRDLLPLLLSPAARGDAATVAEVLGMGDETGVGALADQLALQSTRIDERPALRGVTVPTLVLAGSADRLCGVPQHEELHRLVPGSRLEVLAGAGHLLPLERPVEVAAALGSWWRA